MTFSVEFLTLYRDDLKKKELTRRKVERKRERNFAMKKTNYLPCTLFMKKMDVSIVLIRK